SETLIKSDISIYPNPATDFIFIKNLKGINTYKIFDTSGRIVQQNILNTESIDITALSKGNYILQIVLKDKTQTFKFIKK
ncbi:T9SS type A sorting domain-containing protein, partial [Brevibacillus sp. SIMBA_040]